VRGPCCDRLSLDFTSDPALPTAEILALVLSDVAPSGDPELRRFNPDADTSQQIIQELAARAATGAISSQVSRVFEQALGVDAFRITPSFGDLNVQSSRLEPSARVVLGKRISSRAYLEYSRSLSSSTRDEIITIEFDQSDRTSWILSRNEDQTYALEFRWRRSLD
jgi:hypothetical protein